MDSKKLLDGEIKKNDGNTIVISNGHGETLFNVPEDISSGFSVGDSLRVLFRENKAVRFLNKNTGLLYESGLYTDKNHNKFQKNVIFLCTAVLCSVPLIGALIGLFAIATAIGGSLAYGKKIVFKIGLICAVTAFLYVSAASYFMINGLFFMAFLSCTCITFFSLRHINAIQNKLANDMNDEIMCGISTM